MAHTKTSTGLGKGEPPALRALYRRHLRGKVQGARLRAKRAAMRAQEADQRVRQVQMALFYAICERLNPASPTAVGEIVNRLFLSGAQQPPAHIAPAVRAYFRTMRDRTSYAQRTIASINPCIDAAGVEASMRLQYGTLSHLSRAEFAVEVEIARQCEIEQPGFLRQCASSYGLYPRRTTLQTSSAVPRQS